VSYRAVELAGGFGLDRLSLAQRPRREPGPGQVRVRLAAAALNYRDLMTVRGDYNPSLKLPLVPCSDGAGVVEAVGPGVTRVTVGQRVMTSFFQGWANGPPPGDLFTTSLGGPLDGTLAESILLAETGVLPTPPHLTDIEAATLPCAGLTAWSALVTHGNGLRPGDTILVLGSGGVSIFALQLGRLMGLRVLATTSSEGKRERLLALGASEVINVRTTPDWGKEVRALTGGRGVDLVVEVGGAGTLERSLQAVRPGGQLSLMGVLGGKSGPLNLRLLYMYNVRVQGIIVGHREGFAALARAVELHGLRPVVERTFPLDDFRAAFDTLASGSHVGKLVVTL
jgi:NADPH:quinone reductase-like Zn-dependent oxidoreductase